MMPPRFSTVPIAKLIERGLLPDSLPPPALVLIVDDEPSIVDTLALIFQAAGFATAAAYNGEDALEIAEFTPPDLLLSDVVMPSMNGIELARRMIKLVPDCRILLLSGQAEAVDLMADSGGSRDRFIILAKPIAPLELLAEVSGLLGKP